MRVFVTGGCGVPARWPVREGTAAHEARDPWCRVEDGVRRDREQELA